MNRFKTEKTEKASAMSITMQQITHFDPKTQKLQHLSGVRRGDTVTAIAHLAGEAEAKEFFEAVTKEPERLAPYVSRSGFVVVVFEPQEDRRNSWPAAFEVAPKGKAAAGSFSCSCGRSFKNAGALALHRKANPDH